MKKWTITEDLNERGAWDIMYGTDLIGSAAGEENEMRLIGWVGNFVGLAPFVINWIVEAELVATREEWIDILACVKFGRVEDAVGRSTSVQRIYAIIGQDRTNPEEFPLYYRVGKETSHTPDLLVNFTVHSIEFRDAGPGWFDVHDEIGVRLSVNQHGVEAVWRWAS